MNIHEVINNCTECGACLNACPANAINMSYAEADGSLQAIISETNCIDCGKCFSICPVINSPENANAKIPKCYAVWAIDNIRFASSSGGAFSVLARHVLQQNGYVCGVAFDKEFRAKHVIISKEEDLERLRRSKYIQSDIGFVFQEIASLLSTGKPILFVGTPCQIAGLKAFLQKDYQNLILVDLLCNYAPPYFIFRKYLDENYGINGLKAVEFRVKNYGWACDVHRMTFQDGTIKDKREYNDSFQQGYHSKLYMRSVCEHCKFSDMPRQGDLTIGDCWGVKNYDPRLDDTKGTSIVLINNFKGYLLFNKVKDNFQLVEEVPLSILKYNRQPMVKANPGRDRFYELIKKYSFNKSVDYALNNKFDVGIWGNCSERNYGSELTYYALYKVVSDMGLEVQMIERPRQASWGPNNSPVLFKENPYPEYALFNYATKADMKDLNRRINAMIVGSDQIWHSDLYECFGKVCYLDYIHNDIKKIAFASSFGKDSWSGDESDKEKVSFYLKQFDGISVRETSAVDLCKNYFNIDATWVLDPVFLCDLENFNNLANHSDMVTPKDYIAAYVLDITPNKQKILNEVKRQFGYELSIITDAFDDHALNGWDIPISTNLSIEDWIKNIRDSKFVVTDSFHGMCFAIIFQKPFIAIVNDKRGAVRFVDLLNKLNLLDRLITESAEDITNILSPINYGRVNQILQSEKERSIAWLQNILFSKKQVHYKEYDILSLKIDEAERSILDTLNKHAEMLTRHEEVVNRHEEVINRHEGVVNRHEEVINRHEGVVNRHEEVINRHERVANRNEDVINRHEARLLELEKGIQNLYNSKDFKIGKLILSIPRKIKKALKRMRK